VLTGGNGADVLGRLFSKNVSGKEGGVGALKKLLPYAKRLHKISRFLKTPSKAWALEGTKSA